MRTRNSRVCWSPEQFADSLDVMKKHTGKVLAAFKTVDLYRTCRSSPWGLPEGHRRDQEPPGMGDCGQSQFRDWRETLLSPLRSRLGSDDDRSAVETGSSFGSCGLTEMESDLAAVEALK